MAHVGAAHQENDDEWEYLKHHKYQVYISELMSLKHGRQDAMYPRNKTFTKAELLAVTPADVKRYLMLKAFDDPWPGPLSRPLNARAESLRKYKQAISHFMPNKNVAWLEGRGGNPTRHSSITAAISRVEALETRGLGAAPNDKRPYRDAEYYKVLELFRAEEDFNHRLKYPLMTLWASHLIHRIDDTCHFHVNHPHGNVDFPHTMKTRTKWLKNAKKMRHCPDQILLASSDWKTCVILWYALYLEPWLKQNPTVKFLFTTNPHDEKGPENIKTQYSNRIQRVAWSKPEFRELRDETGDEANRGLGTHSNRKFFSTRAKRRGASDGQVEYRGRWVGERGKRTCSRVYITVDDPYTDAFVASLLCDGGPIKYVLKAGVIVTDNWLFVECVPSIRQRFPHDDRLCRLLGMATLWAAFDAQAAEFMDPTDVDRIRSHFAVVHGEVDGNPVEKKPITILRTENGQLNIVEIENSQANDAPGAIQQPAAAPAMANDQYGGITNAQLCAYLQQMERLLQEQLQGMRQDINSQRTWLTEQLGIVNRNQIRFGGTIGQALARQDHGYQGRIRAHNNAVHQQQQQQQAPPQPPTVVAPPQPQPAPQPQQQAQQQTQQQPVPHLNAMQLQQRDRATNRPTRLGISPHAKLADHIRTLRELWDEWLFGIGNNKPAKDFTTDERNGQGKAFKNKFSRRNMMWRVQGYLINCGHSIDMANSKIARVYGTDKITPLHVIISRDQKNPTCPFVGNQRFRPEILVNRQG